MKEHAAVLEKYGPNFEMTWRRVPILDLREDEVGFVVKTAAVNYADYLMARGEYQDRPTLPFVPGKAVAGVVGAVGRRVYDITPGTQALAWVPGGGFQTRVNVPRNRVFPLPPSSSIGLDTAVAGFLSYLTAKVALTERGRIRRGDRVLVTGAAGAVGRALVHLARASGAAITIGVSSRPGREPQGLGLLPDRILYSCDQDVRGQIMNAAEGMGVSLAVDTVGGSLFDDCYRSLAWNGRLVTLGFAGGGIPSVKAGYLLVKGITVTGFQIGDYLLHKPDVIQHAAADYITALVNQEYSVKIARRFPMSEAAQALHEAATGAYGGKIILYTDSVCAGEV